MGLFLHLARQSVEPILITNKGEANDVYDPKLSRYRLAYLSGK